MGGPHLYEALVLSFDCTLTVQAGIFVFILNLTLNAVALYAQ